MTAALVGHTGFVGSNLAAQRRFDASFNSRTIEEIRGQAFDLIVVSGMPAAMWIANADPPADRAVLERLIGCLLAARAERVVVMSTVAVYPRPVDVDEDSTIDPSAQTPYGRHRLELEHRLRDAFPHLLAVRLPGLFGPGLKKNAIYDLLNNHETDKIHAAATYQYYDLGRVWADVSTALDAGLRIVNFATEPVSIREVAHAAFGIDHAVVPGGEPPRFDVRTRHAGVFGGSGGYLFDRGRVLGDLRRFVEHERATRSAPSGTHG
jgi:nucleoside-diphosphate-sugar epimerase